MTHIHVKKDNGKYVILVEGHNEKLICAGISTLIASFSGYLENFDKGYSYKDGDGVCKIKASKKAEEAVMMFLIGALRLECTYPDKVKVITNINKF